MMLQVTQGLEPQLMGTQKLCELLESGLVALDVEATGVEQILTALPARLVDSGQLTQACGLRLGEALVARERIGSTAVGLGVALPHAYVVDVPKALLMIARLSTPLAYGNPPDGREVDLLFLLTGPASAQRNHVKLLAKVVRLLHDAAWVEAVRAAKSPEDVVAAVRAVEARHV